MSSRARRNRLVGESGEVAVKKIIRDKGGIVYEGDKRELKFHVFLFGLFGDPS
jgi:hypothetical protein